MLLVLLLLLGRRLPEALFFSAISLTMISTNLILLLLLLQLLLLLLLLVLALVHKKPGFRVFLDQDRFCLRPCGR